METFINDTNINDTKVTNVFYLKESSKKNSISDASFQLNNLLLTIVKKKLFPSKYKPYIIAGCKERHWIYGTFQF